MYDCANHGQVKNEKILRWRVELSALDFKSSYRPGKLNVPPDTLSRAFRAVTQVTSRHCKRFTSRFVIQELCACVTSFVLRTCRFLWKMFTKRSVIVVFVLKSNPGFTPLVKATQPFERLSIDFKGPLPSASKYHYLLTIVDRFSMFPFPFPCRSTDAKTVIECLNELFAVFGMCAYIHSDCGPAFLSNELVFYLHRRGIACSRTSVFNLRGNGQSERYNGIIRSSVKPH